MCKIYFFVYKFAYKGSLDFGIPGVMPGVLADGVKYIIVLVSRLYIKIIVEL